MIKMFNYCILTFLTVAFAAESMANEIVFQRGVNGYEGGDGVVIQGNPDSFRRRNLYGSVEWEISGVAWGGSKRLALLAFPNLGGEGKIPEGATIKSARLELFKLRSIEDEGQFREGSRIDLFPMTTPFYPQESIFDERSIQRPEHQYWGARHTIEDGPVAGTDYEAEGSRVSARLIPEEEEAWLVWHITDLVAQWAKDPETNHGVLLQADAYWVGAHFASPLYDDPAFRPRLVVEYESSTGRQK